MSSPIFDSTFRTGRFRREEPMTTSDQSQATPADELRQQIMDPNIPKSEREWWAAHEIERLSALAQSDAGPRETYDKIKGHAVTQSEMAKKRDYELIRNLEKETSEYANKIEQLTKERDEALDVCERLLKEKAALAQSDAGPSVLKTRFEEWAFTRGHRNFTKSGDGYFLPEIQKDWLAFKAGATAPPRPNASAGLIEAATLERYARSIAMWCYRENVTDFERLSYIANHPVTRRYAKRARAADRGVHGELIPDCPTEGVAARQGNGG